MNAIAVRNNAVLSPSTPAAAGAATTSTFLTHCFGRASRLYAATRPIPEPIRAASSGRVAAYIRLARPKQWVKNVLVVAAPAAAGVLGDSTALFRTAIAFICFCLAASGTYYINDALDVEADRRHPTKRNRPIAAGLISVNAAIAGGIVLIV